MRIHAHYFRVFRRERRNRGLLAEQGELETPVSRDTFAKENLRKCWRNFGAKSARILRRVNSPSVRYEFPGYLEFRCREKTTELRNFRPTNSFKALEGGLLSCRSSAA